MPGQCRGCLFWFRWTACGPATRRGRYSVRLRRQPQSARLRVVGRDPGWADVRVSVDRDVTLDAAIGVPHTVDAHFNVTQNRSGSTMKRRWALQRRRRRVVGAPPAPEGSDDSGRPCQAAVLRKDDPYHRLLPMEGGGGG